MEDSTARVQQALCILAYVLSISGHLALYPSTRCGTYICMLITNRLQTGKIRILLADDHRVVREQLAVRLSRETDLEVVGVVSASRAILPEIQVKHPHILLIDPLMRDGFGFATLRQVCAKFPDSVVVVLTAYVDTALNMYFHQLGIQHILTKGIGSSQLLAELRAPFASASLPDSPES